MGLKSILTASKAAQPKRIRMWMLRSKIQKLWRRLRFLEREEMAAWCVLGTLQGEMATYACEQEIGLMSDEQIDIREELKRLLAEFESYGTEVKP